MREFFLLLLLLLLLADNRDEEDKRSDDDSKQQHGGLTTTSCLVTSIITNCSERSDLLLLSMERRTVHPAPARPRDPAQRDLMGTRLVFLSRRPDRVCQGHRGPPGEGLSTFSSPRKKSSKKASLHDILPPPLCVQCISEVVSAVTLNRYHLDGPGRPSRRDPRGWDPQSVT